MQMQLCGKYQNGFTAATHTGNGDNLLMICRDFHYSHSIVAGGLDDIS